MIQVADDLEDAFHSPANPDWSEGRNNLAILYGTTATHPQRSRLLELLPRVSDPECLAAAQRVLIDCGAVSYCVYQQIHRYRKARQILQSLALPNPGPLEELLAVQVEPLRRWLPDISGVSHDELESMMA